MTDVEPDPDPASAPSGAAPAPSRFWPVVAGVATVAALVLAVLWRSEAGDSGRVEEDRREVAEVAAEFGEAYLSYDFDDVDGSGDAVVALATEAFADDFQTTRAPGIEQLFADLQTSTRATTKEVFVSDVGDRRARALVVVDVAASSTANGNQDLTNLSFVLDLLREDGAWRVDAVAPAPQPDITDPLGAEDPPESTDPTSTTAAPDATTDTSAP